MKLESLTKRQIEALISGNNMVIEQLRRQIAKAETRIEVNTIYQKIRSREGVNLKCMEYLKKKFKENEKEQGG